MENNTMKLLGFVFIFICALSTLSASQDSLGTYAKGESIELLQICGTCTYNNITSIILPNSTHMIIDSAMTKRGFEYTYTFSQTDLVGTYLVNGAGDLDGTDNAWAYDFEVTESGHDGIDIEWVLVIALILAYGIILFGFAREEHPPVTMGSILLLMISLYIWMNGFGQLGAQSLLPQVFAAVNFVVGATLTVKSLQELN